MSPSRTWSAGRGAVALAAYQPEPDLFAAQLRSIRDQTLDDFVCLIGADGDVDDVEAQVQGAVPGDNRFRVLGWNDRLGFYANFERILEAVPQDCSWVALSDHDDAWQPDKLARLVPLLAEHSLATGQARVVTPSAARVLAAKTGRRVVTPEALLLQNQVTGSLSVFRRELLDLALPFPRVNTVTQLHDHWLAMCAVAIDGYAVLDEVVGDYIQHGANAVGEAGVGAQRGPLARVRYARELASKYENGSDLRNCLRVCRIMSFGWRSAMIGALLQRAPRRSAWLSETARRFQDRSGVGAVRTIFYGLRSSDVDASTTMTFIAGLPGELLHRWRSASDRRLSGPRRARRGKAA